MAESICDPSRHVATRLMDLGLGYLTLDRAASTLSTGERQRMQLAARRPQPDHRRALCAGRTLHRFAPRQHRRPDRRHARPVADGNSVVLVDHDTQILSAADWMIEMGPGAGANGGSRHRAGYACRCRQNPASQIGRFLSEKAGRPMRRRARRDELFALGRIHLSTRAIHTVKPLDVDIPKGRLTVVTGVSGSGKTTLILESLVPALAAKAIHGALPDHVRALDAEGIAQVKLIDATPIGINVRSTVATYANVHDELRKIFARNAGCQAARLQGGRFLLQHRQAALPVCDGTGDISLDVQFLPDVDIPCPECRGSRYSRDAEPVRHESKQGAAYTLPELMDMDVSDALHACADMKLVSQRLQVLQDLGLGYLTLGEETPSLSGGEAQRLKLASEMGRAQGDSVFVFDEPTIGLHPLDVQHASARL